MFFEFVTRASRRMQTFLTFDPHISGSWLRLSLLFRRALNFHYRAGLNLSPFIVIVCSLPLSSDP